MKIGIFDSGIGGLNVLKELISIYPNNHYIYYGDTKNVPYGNKNKEELLSLSCHIIHFFEEKEVDLIIIACGTVSSNCYKDLLKETNIKIIDIITPTINYINNSCFKNIGLIGTTKTIESNIFQENIKNKNILFKETPSYVPIIENGDILNKKEEIINELNIFNNKIDCLILGCTHYPLLSNVISNYLNVSLIDMGKCLVNEINLTNQTSSKIELYFSYLNDKIIFNINRIILDKKEIIEV